MRDRWIVILGLIISIPLVIYLWLWERNYENPMTPIQQQIWEERQNW